VSVIGNCVAAERALRGWSQERLAALAGMNRSSLAHIERGRQPTLRSAYAIARALDKRVDELFVLDKHTTCLDDQLNTQSSTA